MTTQKNVKLHIGYDLLMSLTLDCLEIFKTFIQIVISQSINHKYWYINGSIHFLVTLSLIIHLRSQIVDREFLAPTSQSWSRYRHARYTCYTEKFWISKSKQLKTISAKNISLLPLANKQYLFIYTF